MFAKLGILCGLLVAAVPVTAATPGERPVKLGDEGKAVVFAEELLSLTGAIADQYVREVSQADLLLAAIKGLHEAVRQSVPADVEAALKSRTSRTGALRTPCC